MESKGIDIKPEGIGGHTEIPADKFEGTGPEKISGARCLGDLAKDYVFFTPGLLFTHGELDKDPVQEFMNEAEGDPQIAFMEFNRPVWNGFRFKDGQAHWDHNLLAIERGRWEDLRKFLGGVGILDSKTKTFYRVVPFSVMVADPAVIDRAAVIPVPVPMIEVVVFGLDGNKRRVVVQSSRAPGLQPPSVVILKPDPKTVEFTKKLLAGVANPGADADAETVEAFA